MKFLFSALVCLSVYSVSFAQDKTVDSSKTQNTSTFKASLTYLSNAVYNGRKDSLALPYVTPSLGYFDKSGFYVSASASYLANASSRFDLFTLETGYDLTISDQVSASFYAEKYFYNKNSTSVKSEMKGGMGASLSYDPGLITLNGGVDLSFSSQTDVFTNLSLGHAFYLGADDQQWSITPTVTANAGSQKYYQAYKKSARIIKRSGVSGGNVYVVGADKFVLLDYEFSVPITYDAKKWGLHFTPTYALPENPISLTRPNGAVLVKEKLENTFYAELGVYVKF